MKNDYSRKIEMICPVCGSKTFESDNEIQDDDVTCLCCKKTFTRDELSNANKNNIDQNLSKIKEEVLQDTKKEMQDMLKKAFGNNKNIKIK